MEKPIPIPSADADGSVDCTYAEEGLVATASDDSSGKCRQLKSSLHESGNDSFREGAHDDIQEDFDESSQLHANPLMENNIASGDADEENNKIDDVESDIDDAGTVERAMSTRTRKQAFDESSQLHVNPLMENNIASGDVDEENNKIDDQESDIDDAGTVKRAMPTRTRKKVKHRHCKAAVMICVVWSITVILISIALGMDWWGINERLSRSGGNCTLCGDNGLDFMLDDVWPTRQPSSSKSTFKFSKIDPPPINLAKVCSPSIHLNRGSGGDVGYCIEACLPAACCLVNNEAALKGLASTLGLLGMSGDQASAYLSTIKGCYSGDTMPVCDAYNEWCATLYSLDFVLESLPRHFFDTCYRKQENEDIIMATSRAFNPVTADDDCGEICSPLACCYDNGQESNNHVRKRYRHHRRYTDSESILETDSRRLVDENECQHFRAQEPLNAKICDAYSPFCNSVDSALAYPSFDPSGTPTQMKSLTPSMQTSKHPSVLPSRSVPPTSYGTRFKPTATENSIVSLPPTSIPSSMPTSFPSIQQTISPTFKPTATKNSMTSLPPTSIPSSTPTSIQQIISPTFKPTATKNSTVSLPPTSIPSAMLTLVSSIQQTTSPTFEPTATKNFTASLPPASIPSAMPTLISSIQQTTSVSPTNENNSSSSTPNPSSFTATKSPTFQSSTTKFPSESNATQPSASLNHTANPSSPSSMENDFQTQQPSS